MSTFVHLHATEVIRLALASIEEIKTYRARAVQAALDMVEDDKCIHMWGLWSHPRYPTRDDALKFAPEVKGAQMMNAVPEHTCKHLIRVAEYLLNNSSLSEAQKMMYVSSDHMHSLL